VSVASLLEDTLRYYWQ